MTFNLTKQRFKFIYLMRVYNKYSASLFAMIISFIRNKSLIYQMTKREVIGRYKGTFIGLGWSFFYPILMLGVYTFVFTVVFKARWGSEGLEETSDFAVILFVGLIIHSLFAEVINRAPGLIFSNANYVKKVVFPLDILPVVVMGAALFHMLISMVVLLCAILLSKGIVEWTVLYVPVIILPLILVILGCAWILASLGVYLRDVGQTIGVITTAMLFLAPVFYPVSALPEKYQIYLFLNPLTFIIEQSRQVLIYGNSPDWNGMLVYSSISIFIAWIGYWWFQKTRKGFADVL